MDDESGRVKGSIKDRIISFLYRKRFKIKLMKNNKLINKRKKIIFINRYQNTNNNFQNISNIRDLKKLGKKVIEVDIKHEKFDFDKYDYYLIEPVKKKGIDSELQVINDKKKSVKSSKKLTENINKNIDKININFKYPLAHQENIPMLEKEIEVDFDKLKSQLINYPNIDIKELEEIKINNDINNLNNVKKVINKYQNKLDEMLNDLNIAEAISDVKFKSNLGISNNKNINSLKQENKYPNVKVNKYSVNNKLISNHNNIIVKSINTNKKSSIKVTDNTQILKLKDANSKFNKDINSTKEYLDFLDKNVNKITKEIETVTKVTGYGRIIKSFLNIATGILTLPFTSVNIFNITLGSALINRGLHGIRKGLDVKKEKKVNYKYEDLSEQINKTKDKTKLTELLINDSLIQINKLKQDISNVDSLALEDLLKLEESLNKKLDEIKKINNKLMNQQEKNKIKIKKVG